MQALCLCPLALFPARERSYQSTQEAYPTPLQSISVASLILSPVFVFHATDVLPQPLSPRSPQESDLPCDLQYTSDFPRHRARNLSDRRKTGRPWAATPCSRW